MGAPVFRFDPNLEHQVEAVAAVCDLFDGLLSDKPDFDFEDAIIPNLPQGEMIGRVAPVESALRTEARAHP
jgi:hypothetical protein